MLPRFGALDVEAERTGGVVRIRGETTEELIHFFLGHTALEPQAGDPLAVQPPGEIAEERIARLGGHTADDQLVARDADDQPLPPLQQLVETMDEPRGTFLEVRMAGRVHRPLVQHDGELDQEVRQVASERGYAGGRPGGGSGGGPSDFLRLRGVVHDPTCGRGVPCGASLRPRSPSYLSLCQTMR